MEEFRRMNRLPPYVFATVNALKMELRRKVKILSIWGWGIPTWPPQNISWINFGKPL